MAVVLGIRIAIVLAGVGTRYVMSGGSTPTQPVISAITAFVTRLRDAGESVIALSDEMSTSAGEEVIVTDIVSNIDIRKLQVRFQRTPPGGVVEDIALTTHHFMKTDGAGAPTAAWVTADYTTAEAAFVTWWGSLRANWPPTCALGQFRWYKSGGAWDITPAPYNPAERVTEVNTAGTGAATALPPQCAVSVTEKTALRPNWGRFYLPAPITAAVLTEGRITNALQDLAVSATVTLYNTMRTAHLIPVVFGRARGEYTRRDEVVLPAKAATIYEILSVQADDVFDVIRSRRWDTVLRRTNTALT